VIADDRKKDLEVALMCSCFRTNEAMASGEKLRRKGEEKKRSHRNAKAKTNDISSINCL